MAFQCVVGGRAGKGNNKNKGILRKNECKEQRKKWNKHKGKSPQIKKIRYPARHRWSSLSHQDISDHVSYDNASNNTHEEDRAKIQKNFFSNRFRSPKIRFLARKKNHRIFMKTRNNSSPTEYKDQVVTEDIMKSLYASDAFSDLKKYKTCLPGSKYGRGCHGQEHTKGPSQRWLGNHTFVKESDIISPSGENPTRKDVQRQTWKKGTDITTDKKAGLTISRTQRAPLTRHKRRRINKPVFNTPKENGDQFTIDERFVKNFLEEDGGCQDYTVSSLSSYEDLQGIPEFLESVAIRTSSDPDRVHVAEVMVKVVVKDINDNAPLFPNETIFGDVQENGPIDLSVAVVSAWDADDASEGTNARLTYSIDKNVIDERSGQAIFTIHPDSGLIQTSICCLDRETTPEYHIQVVAVDGGGLKATSTVLVRLVDVNDNSPRLTRDAYGISVNETWGLGPPDNATLLKVTTLDHDTSNYFHYRVIETSGWGWEHFGVRTIGNKGELYALQTLDFEDPAQRRGFRFMIQVTDRGRGGWSDPRHTHSAWVKVDLLDLNDNPPEFQRPHAHVTVREDTTPGTLLVTLPAYDRDMSGNQGVRYRITGGWGALKINSDGGVILWRALDREMEGGEMGVAKVVGVDEGRPSLTSTATLTIIVTDVNDTPPRLLPPTVLHVVEGAPASPLGVLTATDDDVWTLGHGPPFNLSLSPSNPPYVMELLTLKFDSSADSGRGGGEVWSLKPIDREEHSHLTAEIKISDAGGVSTTYPVTIVIDDINDNPMKPAAKTVYLWKMQGGSSEAALGRVYVEDPDDWDLKDKTFSWLGPPHPLFTLNAQSGAIYASTKVRAGRYELTFSVADRVWRQDDVRANVTVVVKYLTQEALAHSVPITLSPTTPSAITAGWTPKESDGGLGMLISAVKRAVNPREGINVEVVSVFGDSPTSSPQEGSTSKSNSHQFSPGIHDRIGVFPPSVTDHGAPPSPFACVWVCVRHHDGSFMNPIKLQGLLSLNIQQLEKSMKLKVVLKEPPGKDGQDLERQMNSISSTTRVIYSSRGSSGAHIQPSSVASLASKTLPLQVVDNNSTSLVTPRLTRTLRCDYHTPHSFDPNCTPTSCLNGGRCVRADHESRCVCPGGSWGRQCKVLSRTFKGRGWTWVDPLPPCLPTTLSFEVLTAHPEGLLLYSGPLASAQSYPQYPVTPALFVQIVEGRPQVVLQGTQEPRVLTVDTKVDTGSWHHIHLHLDPKGISLMADYCGKGWLEGATNDSHCIAAMTWETPKHRVLWDGGQPLQLGGLAHPRPSPGMYGWSMEPVPENLQGCISNLKVNGQLVDLGEPAYSSNSEGGCTIQENVCSGGCGWRGKCMGYLSQSSCTCDPGWTGPKCATPTVPALFSRNSYMKIALSFTPDPYSITTQLRLKTRGSSTGVLMQLAAQHRSAALTIRLRDGLACAIVTGGKKAITNDETCVEGYHLGDGEWHTVRVERHGHNLMISLDDGDDWLHNETIASILRIVDAESAEDMVREPPTPLFVDKQDGVTVGGLPEYMGVNSVTVHEDLHEICIDDVRVSGHSLPLPPAVNGTSWGQVTTLQQVESGCQNPDVCANTTCLPPLACHPSWHYSTCSCGPGRYLVSGKCQDVDECVYEPCLHGGTCYNLIPGYECTCSPEHTGHNCQWDNLPDYAHPLTAPVVLAALTLSLLMIVVFVIVITIRLHRWRAARGIQLPTCAMENFPEVETVAEAVDTSLTIGEPHIASPDKDIMYLSSLKTNLHNTASVSEEKNCQSILHQTTVLAYEIGKESSFNMPLNTTSPPSDRQFYPSLSLGRSSKSSALLSGDSNFCRRQCLRMLTPSQEDSKIPKGVLLPLPVQDDLRAYAYEGDGSPSDSLTSALVGLCSDAGDVSCTSRGIPESKDFLEFFKVTPDISTLPTKPDVDVITTKPATSRDLPPIISSNVTNSKGNLTLGRKTGSTNNLPSKDHNTISC